MVGGEVVGVHAVPRILRPATPPTGARLAPAGPLKTVQDKKKAHNAVERRYRNSINDRITQLRQLLPPSWTSGPKVRVRGHPFGP